MPDYDEINEVMDDNSDEMTREIFMKEAAKNGWNLAGEAEVLDAVYDVYTGAMQMEEVDMMFFQSFGAFLDGGGKTKREVIDEFLAQTSDLKEDLDDYEQREALDELTDTIRKYEPPRAEKEIFNDVKNEFDLGVDEPKKNNKDYDLSSRPSLDKEPATKEPDAGEKLYDRLIENTHSVYDKVNVYSNRDVFYGEKYKDSKELNISNGQAYTLGRNGGISVTIYALAATGKYTMDQLMDPNQLQAEKAAMFDEVAQKMKTSNLPESQQWLAKQMYEGEKVVKSIINEENKKIDYSQPDLLKNKDFCHLAQLAAVQFDNTQEMENCRKEITELAMKENPAIKNFSDYHQIVTDNVHPVAAFEQTLGIIKNRSGHLTEKKPQNPVSDISEVFASHDFINNTISALSESQKINKDAHYTQMLDPETALGLKAMSGMAQIAYMAQFKFLDKKPELLSGVLEKMAEGNIYKEFKGHYTEGFNYQLGGDTVALQNELQGIAPAPKQAEAAPQQEAQERELSPEELEEAQETYDTLKALVKAGHTKAAADYMYAAAKEDVDGYRNDIDPSPKMKGVETFLKDLCNHNITESDDIILDVFKEIGRKKAESVLSAANNHAEIEKQLREKRIPKFAGLDEKKIPDLSYQIASVSSDDQTAASYMENIIDDATTHVRSQIVNDIPNAMNTGMNVAFNESGSDVNKCNKLTEHLFTSGLYDPKTRMPKSGYVISLNNQGQLTAKSKDGEPQVIDANNPLMRRQHGAEPVDTFKRAEVMQHIQTQLKDMRATNLYLFNHKYKIGHSNSKEFLEMNNSLKEMNKVANATKDPMLEDENFKEAFLKAYKANLAYVNQKRKDANVADDNLDWQPKSNLGQRRYNAAKNFIKMAEQLIPDVIAADKQRELDERKAALEEPEKNLDIKAGGYEEECLKQCKNTIKERGKQCGLLISIYGKGAPKDAEEDFRASLAESIAIKTVGHFYKECEESGIEIPKGNALIEDFDKRVAQATAGIMAREDFNYLVEHNTPAVLTQFATVGNGNRLLQQLSEAGKAVNEQRRNAAQNVNQNVKNNNGPVMG